MNELEKISERLVQNFSDAISSTEDKQELVEAFEKYLYELSNYLQRTKKQNIEKSNDSIISVLEYSTKNIIELPLEYKK